MGIRVQLNHLIEFREIQRRSISKSDFSEIFIQNHQASKQESSTLLFCMYIQSHTVWTLCGSYIKLVLNKKEKKKKPNAMKEMEENRKLYTKDERLSIRRNQIKNKKKQQQQQQAKRK